MLEALQGCMIIAKKIEEFDFLSLAAVVKFV